MPVDHLVDLVERPLVAVSEPSISANFHDPNVRSWEKQTFRYGAPEKRYRTSALPPEADIKLVES